jgi:hypothetical protein
MSEDRTPLSADEAAFVRRVAETYAPPPLTQVERARFDARLDALVAEELPRSRPWLIALAAGTAVLALAIWQTGRQADRDAIERAAAESASPEEAILATATVPIADADDALPVEYRAISDLLVGN